MNKTVNKRIIAVLMALIMLAAMIMVPTLPSVKAEDGDSQECIIAYSRNDGTTRPDWLDGAEYGSLYTILPNAIGDKDHYPGFKRKGYTFYCWNTKADGSGTNYFGGEVLENNEFAPSMKLYAQWILDEDLVNVAYNHNDGESLIDSLDMAAKGKAYRIAYAGELGFQRDDYVFKAWNTKPDGSGTTYNEGDVISAGEEIPAKLYAIWSYAVEVIVTINDSYGFPQLVKHPVLAVDLNDDGVVTVDEALKAAHKGTGLGYATKTNMGTKIITKLWGQKNDLQNGIGLYVNHSEAEDGVDAIASPGTLIDVFFYTDREHLSDAYGYFHYDNPIGILNNGVYSDIQLVYAIFSDYFEGTEDLDFGTKVICPVTNANLTLLDDQFNEVDESLYTIRESDEPGKYEIDIYEVGSYYLEATGEVIDSHDAARKLIPSFTAISVNKAVPTIKASKSSAAVKYKTVKKKAVTAASIKVTNAYGDVTYTKKSGSKYLSVTSSGKIKVKKGTPKGKYWIKVKTVVKATDKNDKASKTVKVTVNVK